MTGRLIGYARVSTEDQNPDLQIRALEAAGCAPVYTERESGATRTKRKVLDAALGHCDPGDTLVVWKIDRLGRSLRDLINIVSELGERGVHFRSLQDHFDTSSPGGKMLFHVLGALAEFERSLTVERTIAGLAAARARGRVGGRRPTYGEAARLKVVSLRAQGHNVYQTAKLMGISRNTVRRLENLPPPSACRKDRP